MSTNKSATMHSVGEGDMMTEFVSQIKSGKSLLQNTKVILNADRSLGRDYLIHGLCEDVV